MRIAGDRDVCIGSGQCVFHEPAVFDQDAGDGLVRVLLERPDGALAESARAAVRMCPSGALSIVEE
ncbi:ferredoxin [Nocardia jiangxiensis]|uniref:ferredoxin n=1 Tax=Nocardia jiangxiensis TaxID=282685 RepID=UPI00030A21E9|nr:(4Fe-4S)-binding protein [Nocardia jiangxiensis]